jgi:hypothetical protein
MFPPRLTAIAHRGRVELNEPDVLELLPPTEDILHLNRGLEDPRAHVAPCDARVVAADGRVRRVHAAVASGLRAAGAGRSATAVLRQYFERREDSMTKQQIERRNVIG